jgi:hypothetical protein
LQPRPIFTTLSSRHREDMGEAASGRTELGRKERMSQRWTEALLADLCLVFDPRLPRLPLLLLHTPSSGLSLLRWGHSNGRGAKGRVHRVQLVRLHFLLSPSLSPFLPPSSPLPAAPKDYETSKQKQPRLHGVLPNKELTAAFSRRCESFSSAFGRRGRRRARKGDEHAWRVAVVVVKGVYEGADGAGTLREEQER